MLTIRLQRVGKKNQPSFRVVVTDKRNSTRSGNSKETVGWYNPIEHTHSLNKERIIFWLGKGAQASGTLHNLLVRNGVIKGKKIDVAPRVKIAYKKESADVSKDESVHGGTKDNTAIT